MQYRSKSFMVCSMLSCACLVLVLAILVDLRHRTLLRREFQRYETTEEDSNTNETKYLIGKSLAAANQEGGKVIVEKGKNVLDGVKKHFSLGKDETEARYLEPEQINGNDLIKGADTTKNALLIVDRNEAKETSHDVSTVSRHTPSRSIQEPLTIFTPSHILLIVAILLILVSVWLIAKSYSPPVTPGTGPCLSPPQAINDAPIPEYCQVLENTLNRLYWSQMGVGANNPKDFIRTIWDEMLQELDAVSDADRNKVLVAASLLARSIEEETPVLNLAEWSRNLLEEIHKGLSISYERPDRNTFDTAWYKKVDCFKTVEVLQDGAPIELVNPAWYWSGQLISKGTIATKSRNKNEGGSDA